MKNLSRRTKTLLAIAGVVVVVVVVGLVLLGPGEAGLFGTTVFHISPQNPTISVGQTIGMSINSWSNCIWLTSNANVAEFMVGPGPMGAGATSPGGISGKSVYVHGLARGQSRITADCPLMTRSTTVTVQ